MREIADGKLSKILKEHKRWYDTDGEEGKFADLGSADLGGANLTDAKLSEANLGGANLQGVAGLRPEDISVVVTLYKAKLDPRLMEAVKNKYPHLLEDMNAKDSIENSQKADTGNISKNQPNNLESKVRGEDLGGVDTPNKYAPTSNSMDCDYAKDGPKNCIFIETTEDGPVGKCIKAQRAKKLRFLPWAFTNVLIKIGCPSNRVFFICDYLRKESIKI